MNNETKGMRLWALSEVILAYSKKNKIGKD